MLADGAQVAQGKLYILGGQWDRITVGSLPAQHPSLAVVIVLKVEYNEAPKNSTLGVELTLDGKPMGVRADGQLSIGHPAGLKRGAPQFAPVAITFPNVQFERPGRYDWKVTVDGEVVGTLPLEVVQLTGLANAKSESE